MNRLSGVSGAGDAVGEEKSASASRIDPGSEPRRFLAAAFGLLHVTAAADLRRHLRRVHAVSVAANRPPRRRPREAPPRSADHPLLGLAADRDRRSEEHTSELQSLMRISYAVLCLKKK